MKNVLFAILLIYLLAGCNNQNGSQEGVQDTMSTEKGNATGNTGNAVSLSKEYHNEKYQFSLQLPGDWEAVENEAYSGLVISIYPKGMENKIKQPLGIHADADLSYITIWPGGLGTEFPSGASENFSAASGLPSLSFTANREQSLLFKVDKGAVWAYFINPQNPPSNWQQMGFIFAQVQTNNFSAACFDKNTGNEKPMDQCDPLTGDTFVRSGTVNENHRDVILAILNSIRLR